MVNTEAKEFSYCGSKVLLTADFFERQLLQAMRVATLLRLEVGSEGGSGGILADAPVAGISVLYVRCIEILGSKCGLPPFVARRRCTITPTSINGAKKA